MSLPSLGIGIGAPGLRDTKKQCRTCPDLCPSHGHPFVTFNPWLNVSVCLCGVRWGEGDLIRWPKADGHQGPLHDCVLDFGEGA